MYVLIGRDSTHGGLVHIDIIGDIFEHKWFEPLNPLLKEGALKLHDTLGDPEDRLLSLLNALDEPRRCTETLGEIGFVRRIWLSQ